MNNNFKSNNRGFSLVEILTALTISSVLLLGVTAFMNGGSVSYRTATTQIALQDDVQETANYLTDLFQRSMDVLFDDNINIDSDSDPEEVIYMFMPKKDSLIGEYEMYYVMYDPSTGNIYVGNKVIPNSDEYNSDLTLDPTKAAPYCKNTNLLVEGVRQFHVDVEHDDGEISIVHCNITFRKNNSDRKTTISIRPRNKDWVYAPGKGNLNSIISRVG